ncbi:MAG: FixH family protein [Anaerolineae bacterium]|nr:FixH family protein [Gloeobacterales cyanobacterium ES-bin-313]
MKYLVAVLLVLATVAPLSALAIEIKSNGQTGSAHLVLDVPVSPLKQGKNTLTLKVTDAKTGKPLAIKDIKVETTMTAKEMEAMGMGGMGSGSAKTAISPTKAPGTYNLKTILPFGGNWQMKVSAKQPSASAVFAVVVK